MIVELNEQVRQLHRLLNSEDVTEWEDGFITSIWARTKEGSDTSSLTEKQIDKIEQLYQRHFEV